MDGADSVAAVEIEMDAGIGEGEGVLSEDAGESTGMLVERQERGEIGGRAGPIGVVLQEIVYCVDYRVRGRRVEGAGHLAGGAAEGGCGGRGPGERVGVGNRGRR